MSTADPRDVVRRHFELYDQGRLEEDFATCWAEDVRIHGFAAQPLQRDQFRGMLSVFASAFSASHHSLDLMLRDGDMVATYWRWSGKHTSDFMGMPPTGREVSIHGIVIDRIKRGRIAERWGSFDQAGLLRQLTEAAAPPPAVAAPAAE